MKKKSVNKLVLAKETVRRLEMPQDYLKDVAGGKPPVEETARTECGGAVSGCC